MPTIGIPGKETLTLRETINHSMNAETAEFLRLAADYCGNQEVSVMEYSGRGMGGSTTTALSLESLPMLLADVLQFVKEQSQENAHFAQKIPDATDFRTDKLGRGLVLY
jgi:hypothetical protein